MGTWMSHLRIAEALLTQIDALDPEMFAIGSIGPDSGMPDEKWESFDPPKRVSHFEYRNDSSECADLDFFRQHLMGVPARETPRFSFLLGYFLHLVTDNLWRQQIWRPHKSKHWDWYKRDRAEFNVETKRDWYGQDFLYIRNHPNSFFHRVFLGAEYDQHFLNFMSPQAFEHQLKHIKTFYQRTDEAVQALYARPYHFLSQSQMDRFIAETSETLFAIYSLLLISGQDIGNHRTSLELIAPIKP
jgi:hypothetical protein